MRRAIAERQLAVAVSEVTVGELSRQVAEKTAKYNELVGDYGRQLRAHLPDLALHGEIEASSFEAEFRQRLLGAGVQILQLPHVTHAALLARDLSGRRPFKRIGTGYRDALIWMTFVEWLQRDAIERTDAFFVSGNSKDFADRFGVLHADLRKDLPAGPTVSLANQLYGVLEAVRPPVDSLHVDAPIAVTTAALVEFESYVRFPADDLPIEEPYVDMPPFDRGFISSLTADRESVEATLLDVLDGIQTWRVSARVNLVIAARLWNWREAVELPAAWRSLAPPATSEYPYVEGTLDSNWVADVRIDGVGAVVDAALTRVVLQLPRS